MPRDDDPKTTKRRCSGGFYVSSSTFTTNSGSKERRVVTEGSVHCEVKVDVVRHRHAKRKAKLWKVITRG